MDRQWTEGPPTPLERAATAAVAGICVAVLAAGGSYTVFYGLALQTFGAVSSGAGGTVVVLFLLLVAIAMSVGGGTLLSKASGVSTWWRSTLFSAAAHAIGIPLWITIDSNFFSRNYFEYMPLVASSAATYAIVVPIIVVFSAFRRDALMRLAITLPLAIATFALRVTALQTESAQLTLASGAVAWVVLPAVSVLGWAMIEPRSHP